jgi:tight adherence protein B
MNAWIPAILAFVAVAFGIIALALVIEALRTLIRRRDLRKRLDNALTELQQHTMVERNLLDEAVLRARDADDLVARMPVLAGAASMLRRARIDWSPLTFVMLIFGFAMAGGVFATAARMPLPLAAVFALLFGMMPYWYVARRRKVRLRKFEETLPDAIDYLARAVRAGHPLTSGIQMVGEELADPLAAEFRTMFDQQRFGVPFEEALLGMCDRVELVDVRIFATSIIVQREVGGASFGEVLDNMADTIRARFAIRREISVYTAQGRMSGVVVGVMPILVGLGMYAQDPDYIRILFEHPTGRVMTIIAAVLQILGFLWIRRIVDVEI